MSPSAVSDQHAADAGRDAHGAPRKDAPATAPRPGRATLGQQLIGADLITPEQLDQALAEGSQKGLRLGETLVEMGMVQEDAILPFIESHLGVAATRLRDGMIDPVAVRLLPRKVAERLDAIALFKVRDTLCVAMADPQNLEQLDELERVTGLHVRPVFTFRSSIQRTLPRCYEEGFEVDTVTADLDESAVQLQADAAEVDLTNVESMVDGSPIINLVNYLLVQAIRAGASDIHIEPSRKFSIVRFRVDGQMYEALRPRRDMHPALVSRIKVMGKMDIAEHNKPQDGRFQVTVEGREVDFRVSTLPTVLGEKIVMRILDKENLTFNLDELGFPPDMLKQLKLLLAKPYGLLLVTGPTGSGKTTTLYSALDLLNDDGRALMTIEDPVEYQIPGVNQIEVHRKSGLTFARGLSTILRSDPDVLLVGEIRDEETARIAITAALTGRLVLTTLHTNNAASSIARLKDMGVDAGLLASAINCIVAQRLARRLCLECREPHPATQEEREELGLDDLPDDLSLHRAKGCALCGGTGYLGRVALYEVMPVHGRTGLMEASTEEILAAALDQGMTTLRQDGMRRCVAGISSLDEIRRVTGDRLL
jgi:type IV pilus assembly protein PilB